MFFEIFLLFLHILYYYFIFKEIFMCGITGFINLDKNIQNSYYIIRNMCKTLAKRGPDEEGFYFSKHGVLRS